VAEVGVQLNRSEDEVRIECEKLSKNWVLSLSDWGALSPHRRKEIGLPVMLNMKLDEVLATLPVPAPVDSSSE
jgi:hypothetical protein